MQRLTVKLTAVVAATGVMAIGGAAFATADGNDSSGATRFSAALTGYEEVPPVSTRASGTFHATVTGSDEISWQLSYRDLESAVQQAHIHFGQRAVNGGVSVFLCSNLSDAPAGTQPCPEPPATISGTAGAEDVVGPAAQGIEPGAFDELLAAMRANVTYANVHSSRFPNGEIRGQILPEAGR
jgi:hypothetical protein